MTNKLEMRVLMTAYSLSREQTAELLGTSVGYLDQVLYNKDREPKDWMVAKLKQEIKKMKLN